jgi:hypothetical protein
MSKVKRFLFTSLVVALVSTGCGYRQQYKPVGQICVPHVDKAEAMQKAEGVLAKMHFAVEKYDPERGYIRTRPLSGAQFFEFWRRDNVGAGSSAEANLHDIRRIAELTISQQGEKLCVGCDVNVQRLSMPEREMSSRAKVYEMFSQSKESMQRLQLHPEQKRDVTWLDTGKDQGLSTRILKRIESQLGQPQKGKAR